MKALLIFIFTIFSFTLLAQEAEQLDIEFVKRLLNKDLPNEIFLKERLKLENPLLQNGTIRGHKVGNGFTMPPRGREPVLEEIKVCKVLESDLKLVLLQDQTFRLYAVFTQDSENENLAEFLEVQFYERSIGVRSYQYLMGSNPLRGEMFQVEWLKSGSGVLRIVYSEKLHHYPIECL